MGYQIIGTPCSNNCFTLLARHFSRSYAVVSLPASLSRLSNNSSIIKVHLIWLGSPWRCSCSWIRLVRSNFVAAIAVIPVSIVKSWYNFSQCFTYQRRSASSPSMLFSKLVFSSLSNTEGFAASSLFSSFPPFCLAFPFFDTWISNKPCQTRALRGTTLLPLSLSQHKVRLEPGQEGK